jgi:hypothetical protein
MNLLHLVLTFNLVTALFILAGCYYLHLKYDERTDRDINTLRSGVSVAGVAGAAIAVSLLGSAATVMFA